jgi:hypothetical protein
MIIIAEESAADWDSHRESGRPSMCVPHSGGAVSMVVYWCPNSGLKAGAT